MSDLDRRLGLLRATSEGFTELTASLSAAQVRAGSYASEWSNAQVASHLGSAAEIFSHLLAAGREGRDAPPGEQWQQIWSRWDALGPEEQVAESARSRAALLSDLESLDPAERQRFRIEAFGRTIDLAALIGLRLNEEIVHRWDVAVSQDPAAVLDPDGVAFMIDEIAALAAWMPAVPGMPEVTVRTTDPGRLFRLSFDPNRSIDRIDDSAGSDRDPAPVVMPAEAFIRLLYGRLDPDHRSQVPDDPRLPGLRSAFPGF